MLGKSISLNSFILGAFALLTAGVLALTYLKTKDSIAESQRRAAQKALLEIVPREHHDNDLLNDTWQIPEALLNKLGLSAPANIHIAKQGEDIVAVIIPSTAPDGYSGDISMTVGINIDGSIAGVRVLAHRETPGLGDKVDLAKSPWILSFNGKSLKTPEAATWLVKKDGGAFDQFTGATITPRAVVNRVKQTLAFFETHKTSIVGGDTAQ